MLSGLTVNNLLLSVVMKLLEVGFKFFLKPASRIHFFNFKK